MEQPTEFKTYKYRWVILLLFCLYSSINFIQFLQYSIISNITVKYYQVDSIFVDLSGLFFMICFVIFCIPFNVLIEKYSLRQTALFSSGLTTIGNLIKLGSASRDRFYVVLIGQFLCAIAQVIMLSVPSKLASTWFGPNEVSTACAIAILGTQIGVAIGSIFSSNFVKNSENMDDIGNDFFNMMIINASLTAAAFILVIFFFKAKPEAPPSQSQMELTTREAPSVKEYLKVLVKNKDYLLILLTIGSSNGMYSAFGIMINETYLYYFPGYEAQLGVIVALAIVAGGCFGSLVFGYLLDKFHHFKITTFFIILGSAITYIFVALTMELKQQLATYFTIPIFGFFVASTLLVGFEFATEVTYPVPEVAACSILNSVIYVFSVCYTLIYGALFEAIGYIATHCIIVAILTLSSLLVFLINPTLKRREANLK